MLKPFLGVQPQIHETAFIAENAIVIGDVTVGEKSSIWFGCVLRGDVNPRLGDRTNVRT
jgi:carbonic anhydrase/acetyltransferase-like protein (isoleucine patch superfamily)